MLSTIHSPLQVTAVLDSHLKSPEAIVEVVKDNYEGYAHNRAEHWLEVIREAQNLPEIDKVLTMHRHFNQFPYLSDTHHWGVTDHWSSLPEFLGTKAGDCEDYAIAKYHSLRLLGVHAEKMRLLFVLKKGDHGSTKATGHMLLLYITQDKIYTLDNGDYLLGDYSEMTDYIPVTSFNEDYSWVERGKGLSNKPLPQTNIGKLTDMLNRLERNELNVPRLNAEFL